MKKNKFIIAAVLAGSIFLQAVAFCKTPHIYFENGFAIGIANTSKAFDVALDLAFVLLPVLFILFFFSGSIYDITHGYEKVLIIRSYSKTKIILKKFFKNMLVLIMIVLFACLVFFFFNRFLLPVATGMLRSIVMYFIMLHAVVLLQCLLELFMPPQATHIILFIYCFISYYIAQVATENALLKILLFPCLMFGMQNGATDNVTIYYLYLLAGVLLNLLFMALCIRKFKKTDIF